MTETPTAGGERKALSQQPYCRRCREKYGVPMQRPSYFGSDPMCAFPQDTFVEANWNCITANAIRDLCRQDEEPTSTVGCADGYAALLPWERLEAFILVRWYKHRGATDGIHVIEEDGLRPMTTEEVEQFLDDSERLA